MSGKNGKNQPNQKCPFSADGEHNCIDGHCNICGGDC